MRVLVAVRVRVADRVADRVLVEDRDGVLDREVVLLLRMWVQWMGSQCHCHGDAT